MKRLLILSLVAVFAAAGCGGSDDNTSTSANTGASTSASTGAAPASSGGGSQLTLAADPQQLAFDKKTLSAKAGKVTITMTNPSPLQHDIAIKGGVSAKGETVGQGGKSTVSVDLKPGKYTFYCSVDGHEAAGMNGELDVS
jgi:plastocyanin